MKKIFTFLVVGLFAFAAQAQEGKTYQVKTLTFEDSDYPTDAPNYLGKTTWSSLIDSPQYGGELLYGENHGDTAHASTSVNYCWYDKGNTNLYSEIPTNWGTRMFWGGGHAISNYWDGNLNNGDYSHQLSVYVADDSGNGQGGHGNNGSDNFCVHYGYKDNSGYSASNLPAIQFGDSVARVVDGMYINNTTYFVNCITNGNGLTTSLGTKDYVKVRALGYKSDGTVDSTETYLAVGKRYLVKDWTYWSLSVLGAVTKVEFNVVGNSDNGYGFSQPAYFCYDDVAVRIPIADSSATVSTLKTRVSNTEEKSFTVYNPIFYEGETLSKDAPEGTSVAFNGDNILNENETETLTLKGMPANVKVNKIEACYVMGDITWGDMEINAFVGDTKIGNLFAAGFLSDYYEDDNTDMIAPLQTLETHELKLTDAAASPNSGDFIFTAKSIAGMTGKSYISNCKIYYELATSTGITDINATSNAVEVARFTADGKRIYAPQKGVNVVRMSDGTTRKVVVK